MKRAGIATAALLAAGLIGTGTQFVHTPPIGGKPMASKEAPIELGELLDEDVEEIDAGLGCTFWSSERTYFLSNANQALFRIGSNLILAPVAETPALGLINGNGTIDATGYQITIKTDGRVVRRFEEGQALAAILTVSKDGQSKSLTGEWACGA